MTQFNRSVLMFLVVVLSLICHPVMAQSNWQLEDYEQWNHTNFRQNPVFNQTFSTSNPDYLLLDAALFFMTNEERAKVGIAPMRYHKLLEVAAYNHSLKMATTGFFSHTNSVDASRSSTSDRGKLAGISNPSFAENIAYNYPGNGNSYLQVASKLMDQWMNSSGHKANILSTNGRQMAGGTYFYDGKIYGTQVFQWFSDIVENPNGGQDQLPRAKANSGANTQPTVVATPNSTSNTSTNSNSKPQSTTTTNSTQKTTNKNEVVVSSQKKKRKSSSEILSIRVGIHRGYLMENVKEGLPKELSTENLTLHASGMLGYRFGKNNYKKSVAGLFVQYGQNFGFTNGVPFLEIEGGVLIQDHLRISVGLGSWINSYTSSYPLTTLGYSFGKKKVKLEFNNTFILPDGGFSIEWRPSLGLVYRLNFLK